MKSADRRRKLYNGRIECIYYQFHGPRPARKIEYQPPSNNVDGASESPIIPSVDVESKTVPVAPQKHVETDEAESAIPPKPEKQVQVAVFGGLTDKAQEQAALFESRLIKRARHLRRWPTKQGITCYRIYDRDIPEIPLVVDRYDDCLHITEYERPSDRDLGQQASWLELMAKAAGKSLEVDRSRIFVKSRLRQRGNTQHEKVAETKQRKEVSEGGLKFLVNLSDFVDTGLFLDHRITREKVRESAQGKRFLNLFGYTGSFSVYAAAGGAISTTTVDWSNTYLSWARDNMNLNGFSGIEHSFQRSNVSEFISDLSEQPMFDLAVIDPPTFSNSKRTEQEWDVQRDHAELIDAVALRMSPNSMMFFSTNSRRFKLDEAALEKYDFREISKQTVPEDFRNRRIHRCWQLNIK